MAALAEADRATSLSAASFNTSVETRSTERIGPVECSTWRGKGEGDLYGRTFGPTFLLLLVAVFGLILAWGKAMQWSIETGHGALTKALGWGALIMLYGVPVLSIVVSKRRVKSPLPIPQPPPTVPRHAYPAAVSVTSGDQRRGRSSGWLWFDGPWLRFEGERFGFRLAARDVALAKKPAILMPNQCRVKLPKGFSSLGLTIRIGLLEGRKFTVVGYDRAKFQSELEAWSASAEPREASVFPPLRYSPEPPTPLPWPRILLAGVFVGLMTVAILSLFIGPNDPRVLSLGLMLGAILPAMLAIGAFGERMNRASNARQLEKVISDHTISET